MPKIPSYTGPGTVRLFSTAPYHSARIHGPHSAGVEGHLRRGVVGGSQPRRLLNNQVRDWKPLRMQGNRDLVRHVKENPDRQRKAELNLLRKERKLLHKTEEAAKTVTLTVYVKTRPLQLLLTPALSLLGRGGLRVQTCGTSEPRTASTSPLVSLVPFSSARHRLSSMKDRMCRTSGESRTGSPRQISPIEATNPCPAGTCQSKKPRA